MSFKKAIDISGLDKNTKELFSNSNKDYITSNGVAGDDLIEPIPNFIKTQSEKVISNKNNAWIVLGRDRTGSRLSGYGGKGDTQAASIDIVVGRMGYKVKKVDENNEQFWVDPDFKSDAARIYISQKTDIDKNFGLVRGKSGISQTKSAIALKADAVRLIGREGIKLITRTDGRNSQGGKVSSVYGIDLIAGNDDSDLQPIPKGTNLQNALDNLVEQVDKLNGIVDAFLMSQMQFNTALTYHFHYSPFFGAPTTPSFDLVIPSGIKTMIELLVNVKRSLLVHKTNIAAFKVTYIMPVGGKYINSRFNTTN
jgi:hypothetical protein